MTSSDERPRIRVQVLLCDHAQVEAGKLFVLGAGISTVGSGAPTSIGVLVYVPWDLTNSEIPYRLQLETQDGQTQLPLVDGLTASVELAGALTVGRPAGALEGVPIQVPIAFSFGPFQDLAAGRYVWRLSLSEETDADWTAAFNLIR